MFFLGCTILNDQQKNVERINASFYKRAYMLKASPILFCSKLVKHATWRSYSMAYCISTLDDIRMASKTAAAHRNLCRTIFRREVKSYIDFEQSINPGHFVPVRSTALYKVLSGQTLLTAQEQYINAKDSLSRRLLQWLRTNAHDLNLENSSGW